MTLSQDLKNAIERLAKADIDTPQLDARLLFCNALHLDRAQLLSQSERVLTAAEGATIDALIARRAKHEPVARIIGKREFWGLNFGLNEATLEPRPDSETLVEAALALVRQESSSNLATNSRPAPPLPLAGRVREGGHPQEPKSIKLLDLGTGTGCLILSLLHELPRATGLGIDLSPRAVAQATQNAAALNLSTRAKFRTGNWLDGITETFDVILSNPPYIPASVLPDLMPEVRDFDPARALDGGADGLAPYRLLLPQLSQFLNPHGFVIFECGFDQAQEIVALFRASQFTNIEIYKDLSGIERCVKAARLD